MRESHIFNNEVPSNRTESVQGTGRASWTLITCFSHPILPCSGLDYLASSSTAHWLSSPAFPGCGNPQNPHTSRAAWCVGSLTIVILLNKKWKVQAWRKHQKGLKPQNNLVVGTNSLLAVWSQPEEKPGA